MAKSTIVVGPVWARLEGPPEVRQAARQAMAVLDPSAQYNRAFQARRWDGVVKFVRPGPRGDEFLSGLTWRVANSIKLAGHERPTITWPDADQQPPLAPALIDFEWRSNQIEAVNKVVRARRSFLQFATRGGKTEIGIEYARQIGGRGLWVTHLKVLLDQTPERFAARLGIKPDVVGGGVSRSEMTGESPVTVAMVQTLTRILEEDSGWFAQFRWVILDEAHHAGAPTWQAILQACVNAQYRLGLSGTAATGNVVTDLKIEGAIGPVFIGATTAELAEKGYVATPDIVILRPPRSSYPGYEAVREMVAPDWRDDPRGILGKLGHKLHAETYRLGILENEARNRLAIATALEHVDVDERFLILCNRVPHAQGLYAALVRRTKRPVWFLNGESKTDERRAILGAYREAERGACLVCTPFFREGVDLPQIDAGMMAGAGKSDIAVWQGLSRMLTARAGKTSAIVYDFEDACVAPHDKDYLTNQYNDRLALYAKQKCKVRYK